MVVGDDRKKKKRRLINPFHDLILDHNVVYDTFVKPVANTGDRPPLMFAIICRRRRRRRRKMLYSTWSIVSAYHCENFITGPMV